MILTIDQGTTSSRAIIFDIDGSVIDSKQEEYPLIYPHNGWVEIDPEKLLESVTNTLKNFQSLKVKCAAITNQRETTIVWDKDTGKAIYNAIVWQDRRTDQYCSSIGSPDLKEQILNKTGLILDPYFSATKIKWILDNVEGARDKAKQGKLLFGTVDTYLMYKLSNHTIHKTDFTNASRTMLFNIHACEWDQDLLDLFDIPASMLPEVMPSDSSFGALEIMNNIEVRAVLGDQHAALFGQHCINKGDLKSTYGTGCFLMVNTGHEAVKSSSGLLTTIGYAFNGEVNYALEGSIYSAGTITQWLRDQLMFFETAKDSENFLNNSLLSNEVFFIPAFNGLGAPYWDSNVRGSFHGLTRDTNKNDLTTAALASISFQTKDIIATLRKDNIQVEKLKIDGGMVENDWFTKHLATSINRSVLIPDNKESTALGVAMMAGIASGLCSEDVLAQAKTREVRAVKEKSKEVLAEYEAWKSILEKQLS